MKIVRINKDGSMNDLDLNLKKNTVLKQLNKSSISKGNNSLCELYKWSYEDKNIICYGWYDGDAGFENKHELIPNGNSSFLEEDSSEKLLFGDIFLVCYEKSELIDYCVSDYAEYYNIVFDGFDDCSEGDLTDKEDGGDNNDDVNGFIIDDIESDESNDSYEYIEDEELDEDCNGY